MTTVAYLAVSPEGRTDKRCISLRPEAARRPAASDRRHPRPGRGRRRPDRPRRPRGQRPVQPGPGTRTVERLQPHGDAGSGRRANSDIDRITEDYRRAAAMVLEAGFDCIEIHLGHNYLLSAFLSPKLNRRSDRFGGSLENRARFPRQVVEAVRARRRGPRWR